MSDMRTRAEGMHLAPSARRALAALARRNGVDATRQELGISAAMLYRLVNGEATTAWRLRRVVARLRTQVAS